MAQTKRRTAAQINADKKLKLKAKEEALDAKAAEIDAKMAALDAKMAEFEVRTSRASDHPGPFEAVSERLPQGAPLGLGEVGNPGPVEPLTDNDLLNVDNAMALEAFMCELVEVVIHDDNNENALLIPLPSVNGINQGFIRGRKQWVKRKYIEALSRARVITYKSDTPDPSKPEVIRVIPASALVFPFSVTNDPNPAGADWFRNLMEQP